MQVRGGIQQSEVTGSIPVSRTSIIAGNSIFLIVEAQVAVNMQAMAPRGGRTREEPQRSVNLVVYYAAVVVVNTVDLGSTASDRRCREGRGTVELTNRNRNVAVAAHLGALSVLLAASLINPPMASAHSVVVATDPDRNGVVAVAPTQVIIVWNERVTNVEETVTGPDNAQWSTGSAQGNGGAQYNVAMRPGAPPGLYTVNWKVISDDGDPVSGSWTYTVKPS
jgi:methionine-rich copper-binding protein CopC